MLEPPLWMQRATRAMRKTLSTLYVFVDLLAWLCLGFVVYLAFAQMGIDVLGFIFALIIIIALKI